MLHLTFGRNVSFALHSVYCATKHTFIQQLVRLFDDAACCPFSREAQFCRKLLKLFALFLCVTVRNKDVAASPRLPRMYGSHVMQVFSHHGHHRTWISMHGNVKPLRLYHLPRLIQTSSRWKDRSGCRSSDSQAISRQARSWFSCSALLFGAK